MEIRGSEKIRSLMGYAFDELDRQVVALRAQGVDLIDFGVGDPIDPTPKMIRRECQAAVEWHAGSGYPSYVGSESFRKAVADWMARRYQAVFNPDSEICATIGSKEAIFHFPQAILDPGDLVLVPNPGYPPYARGTLFANGTVVSLDLSAENGFLPEFDALTADQLHRARILWMNSPHNPTGAIANESFWRHCIKFCQRHEIILASDESYSEVYFRQPPLSPLQFSREGVICFQSLSKRSCMTGYRVGWVAGDPRLIALFKKLKTNIDSGVPTFIQDAAIAALRDETHVEDQRRHYLRRRDVMLNAFAEIGVTIDPPAGTFYLWLPVPAGFSSVEFALRLLDPAIGIVTMPGNWLAETHQGHNPGEGYLRLALIPEESRCFEAAQRLIRGFGSSSARTLR